MSTDSYIRQPKIRNIIITTIINDIFSPETKRLIAKFELLIAKNHKMGGSEYSFIYKGNMYAFSVLAGRERHRKLLHPDLVQEAEPLIEDYNNLMEHKTRISNVLSVLMARCHNEQDVRDALSEQFVLSLSTNRDFLPITNRQRTRPVGFVYLQNSKHADQKQMRLYQDAMEIAYQYIANKLVF